MYLYELTSDLLTSELTYLYGGPVPMKICGPQSQDYAALTMSPFLVPDRQIDR